jgi:threonine synthase
VEHQHDTADAAAPSPEPRPSDFSLLDGRVGAVQFSPEIDEAQRITADRSRPIEERLEAFEDIIDSEVGDTTLNRARHLERQSGLRQLFLKFEGGNPSGTQKDRIAFAQAMDALRRGFEALTVATCGNYGAAVAQAARLAGLGCIVYIPEGYHTRRNPEMEGEGASIRRVPGDYEAAVVASRQAAEKEELYDANPGGANTALQLTAYGQIAWELYDELRDAPAVVAVPVSNGTTLAGIYRGFVSLYRRGKTSRIPRMVAASSVGKNPIVEAFLKGRDHCEDLKPERIRETVVNEPLINWHSSDGDLALEAVRETHGWAASVSDKAMTQTARRLRERESLSALPAATAGLIALLERHAADRFPGDRYVAVVTARRG